jgi:tripartite-type tricarboxylate transporter receptor subunit TctC
MTLLRALLVPALLACSIGAVPAQGIGGDDRMRIVVPFSAGGAVDQIARLIANSMGEGAAIVDNRTGAGGDIGVSAVAKAAPDGKTVLLHTSSHVINPALRGRSEEIARAFDPVARIGAVKFALVVRENLPAKTLAEFVALAKSGKPLSYGSTGHGTTLHIAGEMLNEAAGIKAVHVPYRGLNPAFTDMISGQIDFMITSIIGIQPYVEAGKFRALAVFDDERSAQLPGVPTTVELGYKTLAISNWYGLFLPAGVPDEKRAEVEAKLLAVIRQPGVQAQLTKAGVYGPQPGAQFRAAVEKELAYWPEQLKTLGIQAN